ncbi:MAG: sigma-E processing peptidase SpoIIGA [Eubacteriales bacterium]|nr:sigma-E processing peptidase SpoIIGA [Eubacteriales bacterium]
MRVSIEWFLIDNTVMNCLVFMLSSTLLGTRVRFRSVLAFSLVGAVYALLSLSAFPVLQSLWCKGILFLLFALPFLKTGRSYLSALMCVFISAFLLGGLLTFLTLMLGGSVSKNGTLMGTVPIRAALIGGLLCAVIPRYMRSLIRQRRIKESIVPLRIRTKQGEITLQGFIDSGNLVTEPITGLPVIFVAMNVEGSIPVPFADASGGGVCLAQRPNSVKVKLGVWQSVDAFIATAPNRIDHGEAIVPLTLLCDDRRKNNDKKIFGVALSKTVFGKGKDYLVHAFRRNAAAAAKERGGAGMCPSEQDGQGSTGQADRA